MRILLIGFPGSGKTTQALKISKDLNICIVKTGEMLRVLSAQDIPQAPKLREVMDKGELVDNQFTAEIIKEKLKGEDCKLGFVMDGYPRDVNQLNFFDPKFDLVTHLKISKKEAKKRLLKRGRSDDTQEAIENRIKIQGEKLLGLLEHYRSILFSVDGERSIEQVSAEIEKYIKKNGT